MSVANPITVRFEGGQPILRVEDMEASLRFYAGVLSFSNASWGSDEFTSVNRESTGIYLCRGGQGRGGAWIWIGVEDAEKLHEELTARGVAIRMPPTNFPWALEIHVEDPEWKCDPVRIRPKVKEKHHQSNLVLGLQCLEPQRTPVSPRRVDR